jgi:predicted nucleotidyltransferase
MHDKSALSEITRLLVDRHKCHTVILYGSRARGAADESSDWDVLGVRAEGPSIREALSLGDAWLDAFIHPESHFEKLDEGTLRFLGGRVLVDQHGFGKRLLERVAAFEKQGPPPLADEAAIRAWYPKMLARIARGDIEARYRRAWLRFDALEAWFRLRRMWYRGPKESFAYLAAHDPAAYAVFARALDPAATDDDLAALVASVLG